MSKYRRPNERDSEIKGVGEALQKMMNQYALTSRYSEAELIKSWPDIMGPVIARHTQRIFVKKKVLFVEISSAPLKNEMNMARDKILNRLKEELSGISIEEIRLL